MRTQLDAANSRVQRRGKMLRLCQTLFATIMHASNESVRRSGVVRSGEAEAQYELAKSFVASIEQEIKNDERDSPKWRKGRPARRADTGEARCAS
jgi:hypothetical protein